MPNADLEHEKPTDAPDAGGAGEAGPADADLLLPPRRKTSMLPAFIVLGLAVFIIVAFSLLGLLSKPGGGSLAPSAGSGRVSGTGLVAEPAADALAPILDPGQPPSNIVRALTVPTTAHAHNAAKGTFETDQYDKAVNLTVPASEADVLAFYRHELTRLGWKIESVGAPQHGSGVQILAQKAGSDGWYWEAGVHVEPTTFTGAKDTDTTHFTIELLQESDDD